MAKNEEERKSNYKIDKRQMAQKSLFKGVYNPNLYSNVSEIDIKKSIDKEKNLNNESLYDELSYIEVNFNTGEQYYHKILKMQKNISNNNNSMNHNNQNDDNNNRRLGLIIDDRIQITSTTVKNNPYKYIGLITFLDGNNIQHYCTGTLVGPRDVLTSAHCLYSGGITNRDWFHDFYFYLQLTWNPWGYVAYFKGSYGVVSQGWINEDNIVYDYGILKLNVVDTQYGWFNFRDSSNIDIRSWLFSGVGYPNDKPSSTLWKTQCHPQYAYSSYFTDNNDCIIWNHMDGTSLYAFDSIIFGVYSRTVIKRDTSTCPPCIPGQECICTSTSAPDSHINYHFRITPYKYNLLCDIINNNAVC